jgi:hypothetical protein
MFYIHQSSCISAQQTFSGADIHKLNDAVDNKLQVLEPTYESIPPNILRRMGKAVRIGVGAALPLVKNMPPDGIIIGTANGGMEDCIKFLNQIISYEEGILTPGNFVQSTPNSIASQVSLLSSNKGYNITHVHRGLAFENAVTDAGMLVKEHPSNNYLLGGVDEISTYNHNIDFLAGWYKREAVSNRDLFTTNTNGSLAGEGAAMFLVNGKKAGSLARLRAITMLHTESAETIGNHLKQFLHQQLKPGEEISLFLSGENGDARLLHYADACEAVLAADVTIARFKHMTGEFATASAIALWLCCYILQNEDLPRHMIKIQGPKTKFERVLIYNSYKSVQHSFMIVEG